MKNKASIIATSVGVTCLTLFAIYYFSPEQRMLRNVRSGFEQLQKEKNIADKKYAEAQKIKAAEEKKLSSEAQATGTYTQYCIPTMPCIKTETGINVSWKDASKSVSFIYADFSDKRQMKCNKDGSMDSRNYSFWSKEGDGNEGWMDSDHTCRIDRRADGTPTSVKVFMDGGSHLLSELSINS